MANILVKLQHACIEQGVCVCVCERERERERENELSVPVSG